MRTYLTSLIICLACTGVIARPLDEKSKEADRTRIFTAQFDKTWAACIESASKNFTLDHSEKESGVLTFQSGISFTSAGFKVSVTLKALEDGTTRVQLNPQAKGIGNWGAGGRIAKKFFAGVEKALKDR